MDRCSSQLKSEKAAACLPGDSGRFGAPYTRSAVPSPFCPAAHSKKLTSGTKHSPCSLIAGIRGLLLVKPCLTMCAGVQCGYLQLRMRDLRSPLQDCRGHPGKRCTVHRKAGRGIACTDDGKPTYDCVC